MKDVYFTWEAGACWKKNGSKGNFGLWFNKYVPVYDNNDFSVSPSKSSHPQQSYVDKYGEMAEGNRTVKSLLEKKREDQNDFVKGMAASYCAITIDIKLSSDLIVGMGESHPSENGMILDHNIGVPYIPASTIKGLLRHHYTRLYVEDLEKSGRIEDAPGIREKRDKSKSIWYLDDTFTDIPDMFGGNVDKEGKKQEESGSIIVLDAYPHEIPKIRVDIMNNHYSEYYKGKKPPSDTDSPIPVNFLAVKSGTTYSFTVLIRKNSKGESGYERLMKACEEMFSHGIGSKTAVGYGRFDWGKYLEEREIEKERARKKREEEEEKERKLAEERRLKEEEEKRKEEERIAKEKEAEERAAKRQREEEERQRKEAEERAAALAKGIVGFKDVKYFNALKPIAYIAEDHPLSEDELSILKGVIKRLYLGNKKDKKWKKRNEGYWKTIGQWTGGELKNSWFKEFTGK